MKKRLLALMAAVLLIGGASGVYLLLQDPYADLRVASGIADTDHFRLIDDLEKASELVVVATFTGERDLYQRDTESRHVLQLSQTTVRIEKVLKGNAQAGQEITVFEEGLMPEDDLYVTANGYKWMNEDGRYLLFLRSNPVNDTYLIVGIEQGKYDLNLKERAPEYENMKQAFLDPQVEYMGRDFEYDDFYLLKEQAIRKYGL